MKILILGGNGFIGTHLIENLLAKGHQVTSFDRVANHQIHNGFTQIQGNIMDIEPMEKAVSQHDGAINLVGRLGSTETVTSPFESVETNIKGALHFYEAVKKFNKPAVQITMGAYSWPNTYSITKYAAERFALMYNLYHGTKIAIVRSMNVYGPGQKPAPVRKVVPNFILPAIKHEPILIYGDGEQLIDMLSAQDNAEILARALLEDHNSYETVIEAGTGNPITVNQLADLIVQLSNSKSKKQYLPMRPGEPFRSITRANAQTLEPLGHTPKDFIPLEQGLQKTIKWYQDHLKKYSRNQHQYHRPS